MFIKPVDKLWKTGRTPKGEVFGNVVILFHIFLPTRKSNSLGGLHLCQMIQSQNHHHYR